ncbi:MAG TPA: SDR family NAD(P)-dependent oxidoreductase [Bryobacteraceae bacterium]|nr:SDR family NAD(P)-dependent oxidoreductase [Bryobacteraceae bacterium]
MTLITGASEGLGAACAGEFTRAGALLSLAARSEEGLRRAGGPDALITAGDLTLEETRRAAVERTIERFGRIDILINNAGVGVYRPSWSTPMDEARRMWELNFFAALGMAQLAVPHMRERRSGTIVNVSSIAGKFTLPWLPLYSASKSALGAWTESLRMELGRDGIHAMLVCPGYVKTEFHRHAMGGKPPGKVAAGKRFAVSAEDCARAIRRGVERGARTVMEPRSGWLLVAAGRLFPGLVETALAERAG